MTSPVPVQCSCGQRGTAQQFELGRQRLCERCGQPIPPERLEVKPDATLCLNCQREVERLSRRGRMN